jgi:hypothetical protein
VPMQGGDDAGDPAAASCTQQTDPDDVGPTVTDDGTNRRRIDRIAADDYLDGLDDPDRVPAARLRELRNECEQEESGLSYARRVLQGKLDIVRAEVQRRSEAGAEEAAGVLAALPRILADDERTTAPAHARATRYLVPAGIEHDRRDVDQAADDLALGDLAAHDVDQLAAIVEELRAEEADVSARRRVVLDRIDAIQAELVARYKSGGTTVAEALAHER